MKSYPEFLDVCKENHLWFVKSLFPEEKYRKPLERIIEINDVSLRQTYNLMNDVSLIVFGEAIIALLNRK